jgi:hypothetical protein
MLRVHWMEARHIRLRVVVSLSLATVGLADGTLAAEEMLRALDANVAISLSLQSPSA